MKWYTNMDKEERRNFQKVIVVCAVGAISVLMVPIGFCVIF